MAAGGLGLLGLHQAPTQSDSTLASSESGWDGTWLSSGTYYDGSTHLRRLNVNGGPSEVTRSWMQFVTKLLIKKMFSGNRQSGSETPAYN
jgi:hypothetical protein